MDSISSTSPASKPAKPSLASQPASASARASKPQPPGDRAALSKESSSAPTQQPINFGSWAKPGRALQRGVQAESEVKALQQALNQKGAKLEIYGKYGAETEKAVRQFQDKNQLEADGKVGQNTAARLQANPATPAAAEPGQTRTPDKIAPAGSRKPVDSFAFSSDPLDARSVKDLIERNKSKGKSTMIGIDPHNEPAQQQKIAKIARDGGAQTHKYLEGRGGPTGTGSDARWEKSEKDRTAALANREGIQLRSFDDRDPAMRKWNDQGWQNQSIGQAREAKAEGHSSVEVDNINRDLKGQDNSDQAKAGRAMEFYRKYASEYAKGDMPTLMLKNLSESELKAVSQALRNFDATKEMSPQQLAQQPESIRNNRLPRDMFSDFSINEFDGKATGQERKEIMADLESRERLTRQLGIQPLRSGDTEHYAAMGSFR
jgi:hypothetical protein